MEVFREERLNRIRRDVKRYWRLASGSGEPKPLLLYIDLVQLIAGRAELLKEVRSLRDEEASAALIPPSLS